MSVPLKPVPKTTLTTGLARNTLFNTFGMIWGIVLSFCATPYIIKGLTYEGYGVFSIITLILGYSGAFSTPMAIGSIRFMAKAYAQQDWIKLKEVTIAGVILSGGFALVLSIIIVLSAPYLVHLFKIKEADVLLAITAFRLAALGFLFNGISAALEGLPAAIRRYDMLNYVKTGINTVRVFGIILTIWSGYGLVEIIGIQALFSLISIIIFYGITCYYLGQLQQDNDVQIVQNNNSIDSFRKKWNFRSVIKSIRELFSFSIQLLIQRVIGMIGQQVDKTVVGIYFGPAILTFYTVPLQISDRIPMLINAMAAALYPLSAEVINKEQIEELQLLYMRTTKLLLWLSVFIAILIVVLAQDLLLLWVGPDFAQKSWFILAILAIAAAWRTPLTVADSVYNGLNRVDVGVKISLTYLFGVLTAILFVTPIWGINGAAVAILVISIPITLFGDIWTQRKLLNQKDWYLTGMNYVKPWTIGLLTIFGCMLLPNIGTWWNILLKGTCVFCSLLGGFYFLDRILFIGLWKKFLLLRDKF